MTIMVMMCICVSSYARPFVVCCMGVGPRWVRYGLGWVMGPQVHLAVGWVGLGQLFGGLGWAGSMKIDPRTTLILTDVGSEFQAPRCTLATGNTAAVL